LRREARPKLEGPYLNKKMIEYLETIPFFIAVFFKIFILFSNNKIFKQLGSLLFSFVLHNTYY